MFILSPEEANALIATEDDYQPKFILKIIKM